MMNKLVSQIFSYCKGKDGVRYLGVGERTYWNGL